MFNNIDITKQLKLTPENSTKIDNSYNFIDCKKLLEAVKHRGRNWKVMSSEYFGGKKTADWCQTCFNKFVQIDLLDDDHWNLKSKKRKLEVKQPNIQNANTFIKVIFQEDKGFKHKLITSIVFKDEEKTKTQLEKNDLLHSTHRTKVGTANNQEKPISIEDLDLENDEQERPTKRMKSNTQEPTEIIIIENIDIDKHTELPNQNLSINKQSTSPFRLRNWTEEQNNALLESVSFYGEGDTIPWKEIATKFPNQTPMKCKHHYLNVLNPKLNFNPTWAPEEDKKLVEGVERYKSRWDIISQKHMKNRSPAACATRFKRHLQNQGSLNTPLDQKLKSSAILDPKLKSRTTWTPKDDEKLIAAVKKYGKNWDKIAKKCMENRSPSSCSTRYTRYLQAKFSENISIDNNIDSDTDIDE